MKLRARRLLVAAAITTVLVAAQAGTAEARTSDRTWYQSIGRSGPDQPCPDSPPADAAAGWSPWWSSWEQWPNAGSGGFVCSRAITWAKRQVSAPSAGCVLAVTDPIVAYADFGGGYALRGGLDMPPAAVPYDPACSAWIGGWAFTYNMVYAPAGYDPEDLCEEAWGFTGTPQDNGTGVWGCDVVVP